MSEELRAVWGRVLERVEQVAPATRTAMRRSDVDVAAAQRTLELDFGEELTTWFELVEGSTMTGAAEVFPSNNVIGVDAAVLQTQRSRRIWGDLEPLNYGDDLSLAGTATSTFRHEYVFVGIDGLGGGLFVDLRGGPLHGCVRWWDEVEADAWRPDPLADSITDVLDRVLAALTSGESVQGWTPTVTDEGLLTWDASDSA